MVHSVFDLHKTGLIDIQLTVRIVVQPAILYFKAVFRNRLPPKPNLLSSVSIPRNSITALMQFSSSCTGMTAACSAWAVGIRNMADTAKTEAVTLSFSTSFHTPLFDFIDTRSRSASSAFPPACAGFVPKRLPQQLKRSFQRFQPRKNLSGGHTLSLLI